MKKNIRLRIFGTISRGEGDETEKDAIHVETAGTLTVEGGRVALRYTQLTEEETNAVYTLSFAQAEPEVVTLTREGAMSSVLTFSPGGRFTGRYHFGFADMIFTVATRRVVNKLDIANGGTVLLDYGTEAQGVPLQTARFRYEVICEKPKMRAKPLK